ncbi:MAG: hypothetical protein JSR73_12150 [Proteobacteria bacterium]|nr:hypothetical protein [Pseudomonadota bacterium]
MKPLPILTAFKKVLGLGGPTWAAWRALVGGAFGCALTPDEAAVFRELTGGREPLSLPARMLVFAIGRRGGKDYVAVRILIYLALFVSWPLAAGEVGALLLIAVTKEQAQVAMRYLVGALESVPALWQEVASTTNDTVVFRNGIEIRIAAADKASVRGVTLLGACLDEFAFLNNYQATELLRALGPAMATQPNARLVIISSVYAANSPLGELYRRHFGTDDPHTLFALATTRQMNPNIPQSFIDEELARDPVGNSAEYLSIFRSDVAEFIDQSLVDSLTRSEPRELPRQRTTRDGSNVIYYAGLDVSGGRGDAAACAIAHVEGDRVVVDACRRWGAPHDPKVVAAQVADFLATYGLSAATGDTYGAGLARSIYNDAGIELIAAEMVRSDIYLRLLPLMTTARIELPPEPILRVELLGLERRSGRNGKESIDHRPGGHDDLANSVAIAAVCASRAMGKPGEAFVIRNEFFDDYANPERGILPRGFWDGF